MSARISAVRAPPRAQRWEIIAEQLHVMFEPASKPRDRPGIRSVVCVEAADHLLGVAFRTTPTGDQQLLDETARLLGYLSLSNLAIHR